MPEPEHRPDLLILGDSHTAALVAGARATGLRVGHLYLSGNVWHAGHVTGHPLRGLTSQRRKIAMAINRLRIDAGVPGLFTPGLPVVASFGYHLGRMVPVFGLGGHSADPATQGHFISRGFAMAYVRALRGGLIDALVAGARKAPVTVVAPPVVQPDPTAMALARAITAHLREGGVRVVDPRDDMGLAGDPLPDALRAEDGVHGNDAYGLGVMRQLAAQGLIPGEGALPSPAA
jgi:hypothetical protein